MIWQEYKRNLRSKGNILFLMVSIIPIVISYYTTWYEKMDWLRQYKHPDSDVYSAEGFLTIAKGYNGFTYLSKFLFSTDFMIFFLLIILIGFAAVSGTKLYGHRRDGYGNLLVSRMGFRIYLKNLIISQNLYIITVMTVQFIILAAVTFIIFPITKNEYFVTALNLYGTTDVFYQFMVCVKQYLVILVYILMLMNITMLSGCLISKRYILQSLPVMIYLIPMLIGSTIESISFPVARRLLIISPNRYLLSYYSLHIEEQSNLEAFLHFAVLPAIFLIVIVLLYKCCSRLEKNYI